MPNMDGTGPRVGRNNNGRGMRMGRPRLNRCIEMNPGEKFFKPLGIPAVDLEQNILSHEEYEALRLADYEGHDQNTVAEKMKTSQSTIQRILEDARRKVVDAIVNDKAIRIG